MYVQVSFSENLYFRKDKFMRNLGNNERQRTRFAAHYI